MGGGEYTEKEKEERTRKRRKENRVAEQSAGDGGYYSARGPSRDVADASVRWLTLLTRRSTVLRRHHRSRAIERVVARVHRE